MTITEVSRQYDISPDTLRYYERIGLLPPVPRDSRGVRDYDEASCGWVSLMKCMRSAGVGIEALTEYVNLFRQGSGTAAARKQILIDQRAQLERRVEELQVALGRLDKKIESYEELVLPVEEKIRAQ